MRAPIVRIVGFSICTFLQVSERLLAPVAVGQALDLRLRAATRWNKMNDIHVTEDPGRTAAQFRILREAFA